MAINIPIITSLEDKGIKAAKAAFANFKTSVADAQGGMNKFKAGSKSALDAVSANAGAFAIAGGIAFAKFAASGINAFQDLALSAGKFADATGLTVEDASRWREVAGDIGVGSDSIQTSINKMNKALGTSPQLFNDLGIEIAKTDTGATDVNQTFLNVIDKLKSIKDPAERAKVATQLLGKGWMDMAELIQQGSSSLKSSLAGVSDAQVIDPRELKRAREYRASQENLADTFKTLQITVGESLVPSLTKLGEIIVWVADKLDFQVGKAKSSDGALTQLGQIWDGWFGSSEDAAAGIDTATTALTDQEKIAKANAAAILASNIATAKLKAEMERLVAPIEMVNYQWEKLTGALSETVAIDTAKQQIADLSDAAAKAFTSGSQEDLAAYHQLLLDATTSIATLAGGLDIVSNKAIKIKVDAGDLEGALALIELIKGNAVLIGKAADIARSSGQGLHIPGRASGGPVSAGQTYMVGERGVELFTPSTAGTITPNGGMGGGNTITINVSGGDPQAVVRALQTYVRTIGPVPVNTRTM